MTMTVTKATGSVRWIRKPEQGYGRLSITSQTKQGPVTTEYDCQIEATTVYLAKDNDEILTVHMGQYPSCSCADAQYRRQGSCKHINALKAALKAIEAPKPEPKQEPKPEQDYCFECRKPIPARQFYCESCSYL